MISDLAGLCPCAHFSAFVLRHIALILGPSLTWEDDYPMIEQVGQGRMLAGLEQTTCFSGRSAALLLSVFLTSGPALAENARVDGPELDQRSNQELAHRREGEAILALAD